ncbi:hypothetical protein [Brevibacillus brevis]|uniref:hypothetical protein n=1 Tax=Brevibacillus brevis TaxID=1393 RepID=UPI001643CF13|nr:hypothetical protein [Brevibacillus brevis]
MLSYIGNGAYCYANTHPCFWRRLENPGMLLQWKFLMEMFSYGLESKLFGEVVKN